MLRVERLGDISREQAVRQPSSMEKTESEDENPSESEGLDTEALYPGGAFSSTAQTASMTQSSSNPLAPGVNAISGLPQYGTQYVGHEDDSLLTWETMSTADCNDKSIIDKPGGDINSNHDQFDQAHLEPGERIIYGMSYSQSMDAYQTNICALGTGLDGRAERSELRKAMRSFHLRFFPHDFKKPPASTLHNTSAGQSATKRARDDEAANKMHAAKRKKSIRAKSLDSGLAIQTSHAVKSSARSSKQPTKQKAGGIDNQGSAIPNSHLKDVLQPPSDFQEATSRIDPKASALDDGAIRTKGRAGSKMQNRLLKTGRTPARPPQTAISPSSLPSQPSARRTPVSTHTQPTSSSSDARFCQHTHSISSSSTSSVVDNQPSYDEEDDDEDEYEEKRSQKKSAQNRGSSSNLNKKRASAKGGASKKNSSWTEEEYKALWRLLVARRDLEKANEKMNVLKDEKLMELMSLQLAEKGIFRSKNACKNYWNRFGRERSKFEERVGGVTNRSLTTSAQTRRR
jgi:hypothetical protein